MPSTTASSLPRPKTSPRIPQAALKSPSSLQSKFSLAAKPNYTSSPPPASKSANLNPSKSIIRLSLFKHFFDPNNSGSKPSPKLAPPPSTHTPSPPKSSPTSIPRSVPIQPASKRLSKRTSDSKPRQLAGPSTSTVSNGRLTSAKPVAPLQPEPSSSATRNGSLSISIAPRKSSPPRFTPPKIPNSGASTLTLVSMHSASDGDPSELVAIRLPSSPPRAPAPLSPDLSSPSPVTPSPLALLADFPLPPRALPFNPHAPPNIPLPPLPSSSPHILPAAQSTEDLLEMYFEQHSSPTAQPELAWLAQETAEDVDVELSDDEADDASSEIDLAEPIDQMAVRLGYQAGLDERSEAGSSAAGDEAEELADEDEIAQEREYGHFGALKTSPPKILRGISSHAGLRPATAVRERQSYSSLRSTVGKGSSRSLRLVIAETSSSDEEEFDLTLDHQTRRPQPQRSPLPHTHTPVWAQEGVRRGSSGSMGSLVTTPTSSSCQTCQTGLATPSSVGPRRELGSLFGDDVCQYPPGKPGSVERREWLTRGRLGRRASEAPLPFSLPPSRSPSAERATQTVPPTRSSAGIRLRRLMLVDYQERRTSQPIGSSYSTSSLACAIAAQRPATSGIAYTHSSGKGSSFGFNDPGWSRVRNHQ